MAPLFYALRVLFVQDSLQSRHNGRAALSVAVDFNLAQFSEVNIALALERVHNGVELRVLRLVLGQLLLQGGNGGDVGGGLR